MSEPVMCEATNPDNGDQCQCFFGHGGRHRATRMWDSPYRMTRPTSCDALVIDGGKVWRPVFGPDGMWEAGNDSDSVAWETFTDPQPFQNCILTADDPEPPIGSVVRDDHCGSYERIDSGPLGWRASRSGYHVGWVDITETTVTLLYRGEA